MKKSFLANVDKDLLCFLVAVAFLGGIGAGVHAVGMRKDKVRTHKENVSETMKNNCDTVANITKNVVDLITTKQK